MKNPIKITDYEYKLYHAQKSIGYQFQSEELLLQALTHPSAVPGAAKLYSYERLEFLGDSLLGSYVARCVFKRFPTFDEGKLSKIKTSLISGETLSNVALEIGLAESIIVGSSEVNTNRRGLKSALENVYESICAAIFLDGGHRPLEIFIDKTLIGRMDNTDASKVDNPKSKLQETLQSKKLTPTYSIIDEFGPAHCKQFVAEVICNKYTLASGQGKTKKEAEINAAMGALKAIKDKKIRIEELNK